MKCFRCGFENKPNKRFCTKCGSKLILKCLQCDSKIEAGDDFCGECGHAVIQPKEAPSIDFNQPQSYTPKFLVNKILTTRSAIEGERKVVTVLFADVANYTGISEKLDPEEVHQIMDDCFKILMDEIHKYEGTINQFTGDGVMALFGAPVAHEDHAQRACHAALSIQKTIGEYGEKVKKNRGVNFKMRIGLNSGLVIVGSIGDDLRMDYTAVGDTTNLASRLESMAKPGTILVSRDTYRLVKNFFEFKSLGKLEVSGKEELQEAFELLKTGELDTRIAASMAKGLTRFVGRKNSMTALIETYNKVQSGLGQVVGVVGEAGVGKSRLLFEFRNRLTQNEYTYLEGRCLHYGGSMAYLPILDIVKSYFDIKEGEQEYQIKKKIEVRISELDENLKVNLPPINDLLSLKVEDGAYLRLNSKQKRESIFEAVRDLFIRLSQNKILILGIEDLHWIDKTSEEFLDYIIGWLSNTRILLILLYRPEYTHKWGSKSYYNRVGLDQLTTKSSAELVQAILKGAEAARELGELILTRATGNPLFMEEFTHTLLENGTILRKGNQYVLSRKASDIEMPDTIQGIIAARIDRVEDNHKRIMQTASVIGREFAFRILQSITGMREGLKSSLHNLQGLEFIYEKSLFPELEYIFKHALIQEVAYNSLLLKRRREIHEKVGRAIEALYPDRLEEYYELLAYHYARSVDTDKAMEYLELANQKTIKAHAMEEAKVYFDEAMQILDSLPETDVNRKVRISLLVNQVTVFLLLFKIPEYYNLLTRYESMAEGLGNLDLLGTFYARLGHCEFTLGYIDNSILTLNKAAKLADTSGNITAAGYVYERLEWSHLYTGDYDRVLAYKEKVILKMKEEFNLRCYVFSLSAVTLAYIDLGRWDNAMEVGQKNLSVTEESGDNSLISRSARDLTLLCTSKGDLARAIEYGELSSHKAPTPADKAWAQRSLGWAWCRAGEPNKGIEMLVAVLPIFLKGDFMPGTIPAMCHLGEGYWLAGEDDKARETLEKGLEIADRCGAKYYAGFARRLLGEIALKTDQVQATTHFKKSIDILQEIKAENELALAYAGYGRLQQKQGKITRAQDYLMKALEIFERLNTLIEPDRVREELTRLSKA